MPDQTLSAADVRRFYDSIRKRYNWFESFESQAKFGLDISSVMLDLTRERISAPLCQADVIRLPIARERL